MVGRILLDEAQVLPVPFDHLGDRRVDDFSGAGAERTSSHIGTHSRVMSQRDEFRVPGDGVDAVGHPRDRRLA